MVIREIITSRGVRVRICDDCMAERGSMEERRIMAEQNRIANEILKAAVKEKNSAND